MKTTFLRLLGLVMLLLLGLCLLPARAQTITVAADGSGSFRTIQEAINSLPETATKPRTVFIKNGTYREKVFIDGKNNLIIKGQSETGVILTYPQARDMWTCGPRHHCRRLGRGHPQPAQQPRPHPRNPQRCQQLRLRGHG